MKNFIFLVITSLFSSVYVLAQDTIYRDGKNNVVSITDDWKTKTFLHAESNANGTIYHGFTYSPSNILKSEAYYLDNQLKKKQGEYFEFFSDRTVKLKTTYVNNEKDGVFETYFENGRLRRRDNYSNGAFVSGNCYDSVGVKIDYFPYETGAYFPECSDFANDPPNLDECFIQHIFAHLEKNLVYPKEGRDKNIVGKVIVQFDVSIEGKIQNARVVKSVHEVLDKEALRVIELLPLLIPAKEENIPVVISYRIPINFTLN